MNRRWWWAALPFSIGLISALVIILTDAPDPLLYIQADLGTVVFGVGLAFSILVAIGMVVLDQIDKTKRKVAIQYSKDRRRFLQRLDHELKNPLTAILAGLANLTINETPSDRSSSLKSVQSQVDRLRRLVAELRKLAELETRSLDTDPINLDELLEDAFSLAKDNPDAGNRTLTFSTPRAPWPLPTINGDRDLLILAIHNLLDNAIKFTRPGDTIEMRAFEDNSGVVLEVADTGPGIPVEDQDHVWEELYRGNSARGIPGSGLGLALTQAIIFRHGGTINLRSRAGEGTVFTVRLPT
ncbi:MAG: HAMP domain-containing sensor histidine kinase [Chloroflexota bacterium]